MTNLIHDYKVVQAKTKGPPMFGVFNPEGKLIFLNQNPPSYMPSEFVWMALEALVNMDLALRGESS